MASADDAQGFLNAIKAIFGAAGCVFLVSISENAMSSFERRGLGFRDAFDSSFDEVLLVEPMTLRESQRLLHRRVVGLTDPYVKLCHALAGGLARDLIRVTRRLDLLQRDRSELTFGEVARELVQAEIERKAAASAVAARGIGAEPALTDTLIWARAFAACFSGADLVAHVVSPVHNGVGGGAIAAQSDPELEELRLQLAAFAYFASTVLDYMTRDANATAIRSRVPDESAAAEETTTARLARTRQALELSGRLGWKLVTDFRVDHGLAELPSPDVTAAIAHK
jgi:hypothetical protein